MASLTEYTSFADAQAHVSAARLCQLFDGDRDRLNIAHECIDRHAGKADAAVIVAHGDGGGEILSFRALSEDSARFAHYLAAEGVKAGDRVAIMLEPSRVFYTAVFGTMKLGAIAVPLFALFGPDGVKFRVDDCSPALLVTNVEKAQLLSSLGGPRVVVVDADFIAGLARFPSRFAPPTKAVALAIFQYTSGTTRELPEAVKHTHRSIVTLMVAALYGTGLRPGDRYFS